MDLHIEKQRKQIIKQTQGKHLPTSYPRLKVSRDSSQSLQWCNRWHRRLGSVHSGCFLLLLDLALFLCSGVGSSTVCSHFRGVPVPAWAYLWAAVLWQVVSPSRVHLHPCPPQCPLLCASSCIFSVPSDVSSCVSFCVSWHGSLWASCPQQLLPFLTYVWAEALCAPLTSWGFGTGWVGCWAGWNWLWLHRMIHGILPHRSLLQPSATQTLPVMLTIPSQDGYWPSSALAHAHTCTHTHSRFFLAKQFPAHTDLRHTCRHWSHLKWNEQTPRDGTYLWMELLCCMNVHFITAFFYLLPQSPLYSGILWLQGKWGAENSHLSILSAWDTRGDTHTVLGLLERKIVWSPVFEGFVYRGGRGFILTHHGELCL